MYWKCQKYLNTFPKLKDTDLIWKSGKSLSISARMQEFENIPDSSRFQKGNIDWNTNRNRSYQKLSKLSIS